VQDAPPGRQMRAVLAPDNRPFGEQPDLRYLFHSAAYEAASQALLDAVRRRAGAAVLTGLTGVGKTMLCRALVRRFDAGTRAAVVAGTCESVETILRAVLVDLGVATGGDLERVSTREHLIGALTGFSGTLRGRQTTAVVVIDGAHDLPADVLNDLGGLIDGEGGGLQLVLVGQPALLTALDRPELTGFSARVGVRCTLEPLAADEVGDYVTHRMVVGDSFGVEFRASAIDRVFDLSGGIPRTVNRLCDRALSIASGLSTSTINDRVIESAAEDLDISLPETGWTPLRIAGVVLVLLTLVALGAGAAAYLYRAELAGLFAAFPRYDLISGPLCCACGPYGSACPSG
jgi:general secretion pathway protein A